ncbi:MAG: type IV pilus assembly protein PilM [Thermodesulfobacteriota bacterium]|jgi:type IV pilus assembly protein PilM
MLFSSADKDNNIGVDIGSQAIKVCHLAHDRKGISLKSFGLANLPSSSIVNGVIKEPRIIADTLQSLLANLQITKKETVFAISGYSVITKKIILPVTPEKELAQSIQYEAQQHIPFDIKEVNLDFQILSPVKGDMDSMSVLLVAAKKETLNAYLEVIELSGLEASIADVAAFALANAYENSYPLDSSPVALVNIGAGQITLHVLNQDGPVFTRDIYSGGRQLTEQIQSLWNLSFEEAENIKLGRNRMSDQLDRIGPSFLSTVKTWMEEIKQVLDVLTASDPETKPKKIVLSGGSSLMPGLPQFLSKGLQLPVELFNPFSQIRIDPEIFDPNYLQRLGPQLAIAFGLALRQKGK